MALLFLIPILVCGYYFLTQSHIHKYKAKKIDGQQLYFKSGLFGFFFTFCGFVLTAFLISHSFPFFKYNFLEIKILTSKAVYFAIHNRNYIANSSNSSILEDSMRKINFYVFFALSFIVTLFLVLVFTKIHRYFYITKDLFLLLGTLSFIKKIRAFINTVVKAFYWLRNSKPNKRAEVKKLSVFRLTLKKWDDGISSIKKEIKNPIDTILYESIEFHQHLDAKINFNEFKLIMLTMSDRKIYIGLVVGFGIDKDIFSIDNTTFYFLPFKSGYRNKYDLRICITTDYMETIKTTKSLEDIQIVLNKSQIISATKFNEERFKSFDKSAKFKLP